MPKFLNKTILVLTCPMGTTFFVVPDVFAYNNITTHPALTDESVDLYNFSPAGAEITNQQKEWMVAGSNKEDVLPRPMNHFYDPIYKTAWTGAKEGMLPSELLGLLTTLAVGEEPRSAVEWANDSFVQQKYAYYEGDRSWPKAMEYCANGNLTEAYKNLGHILHLIQDMAVPEHTRDDSHAAVGLIGDNGSPYEDYTAKWNRNNLLVAQELKNKNVSLTQKSTISDYLISVAEYSNKYFFSADTINDVRYPSPKASISNAGQCDENFCYGVDEFNKKFPLAKIINIKENGFKLNTLYVLDKTSDSILDAYFSRLSKQAVLNGAGVIALFQKQCVDAAVNKDFPTHLIKYDTAKLSSPIISLVGEAAKIIDSISNFISGVLGTNNGQQANISPSPDLVTVTPSSTTSPIPQPPLFKEAISKISQIVPTPNSFYTETARVIILNQTIPTVSATPKPLTEPSPTPQPTPTPTPIPTSKSLAQYFSSGYSANPATPTPTPKPTPTPIVYCNQSTSVVASEKAVIINEIAWMGTNNSSSDEWIELKNISSQPVDIKNWQLLDKDEQIKIVFGRNNENTVLSPNYFYLLERTDDNSVPGVAADLIYTGALNDTGESLKLFDQNCYLIDEVGANPDWPAGDKNGRRTMERSDDLTWHTYNGDGVNGIFGTPREENSVPLIPTPTPTSEPTPTPTPEVLVEPSVTPEPEPTVTPTMEPTIQPTPEPTLSPTLNPTFSPEATAEPTSTLTPEPTVEPTILPTSEPTIEPTSTPTPEPEPTATPTPTPILTPTPTPAPTPTPTPKILISEVLYDQADIYKDREFIELYNADSVDFDLKNWSLRLLETSSTSTFDINYWSAEESTSTKSLATFAYGSKKDEDITQIKGNGYLLIGLNKYASSTINDRASDILRSSAELKAKDGNLYYILLLDDQHNLIDSILYNKETFSDGIVLERKALVGEACVDPQFEGKFLGNGCDTDTVDDFIVRNGPEPQNSQSLLEPRSKPPKPINLQGEIQDGDELILSFDLESAASSTPSFILKYSPSPEDLSEENWNNLVTPDSQYLGLNPDSQKYEFALKNFSAGTYYFALRGEDEEGLQSDASDIYEFIIPFCAPHYVDVGNPYITNIAFYSCLGKNWLDFTYYNFPNPFVCQGRYCALGFAFLLNSATTCNSSECFHGFNDNLPVSALSVENWHEKKFFIVSDNYNISSLDNGAGNFDDFHFEIDGNFQENDFVLPAVFGWGGSGWWGVIKEAMAKDYVFFEKNPRKPLVLEPRDFVVSFDELNQKLNFQSTSSGEQSNLTYEIRYSTIGPINGLNWSSATPLANGSVVDGKIEIGISDLPIATKNYLGLKLFNGYRYSSVGQFELYISLPTVDCSAVGGNNVICENFENYQVGNFLGAPNYQQGAWIPGNNSGPWQIESEMGVASSQFLRAAYAYWLDHTAMRREFPLITKGELSLWVKPKSEQSQMYIVPGVPFQLINGSNIKAYNNGQIINYPVKAVVGRWANWQFKWDANSQKYWFRINDNDWMEMDWNSDGVSRLEFNIWFDDVYFKNILLNQE